MTVSNRNYGFIQICRMTEEDDVVIAEGTVLARREDGANLPLAFFDVFEMHRGKIRRLVSCLMETHPLAS